MHHQCEAWEIGEGITIYREFLFEETDSGSAYTFQVPNVLPTGVYYLGCNIHLDMKARIIVQR